MMHRSSPVLLLLATACGGGFDVFPEKGIIDSGLQTFDPAGVNDTGFTGNSGSGSSNGGSGGSGGSGGDTSGGSGSGGDTSGSGSSGDGGSGDGGSGDGGTTGGDSGGDTSGSGGSGGSGSSGSGSGGSGSSGSGSSGSGSSGSGSGGPTSGNGEYVIEQAIGESYPGYYPCEYVFDMYFSSSSTYCSGCDFVLDANIVYNSASSYLGASYCSVTTTSFTATMAHDSDYLGSLSTALYSYYGTWYPLDYNARYSSGRWSMAWGFRDYNPFSSYYYYYSPFSYYYTDYRTIDARLY